MSRFSFGVCLPLAGRVRKPRTEEGGESREQWVAEGYLVVDVVALSYSPAEGPRARPGSVLQEGKIPVTLPEEDLVASSAGRV